MTFRVVMPQLGETVAEGTVTRWLKSVGEQVTVEEPLVEISTDKVDTEVPSPASGVVLKILVEEDTTVGVGAVLALLGEPTDPPSSASVASLPASGPPPAAAVEPSPVSARASVAPASVETSLPPTEVRRRHNASPRVRRAAADRGVNLTGLPGTGPGGRVLLTDLDRVARASNSTVPAAAEVRAAVPVVAPAPVPTSVAPQTAALLETAAADARREPMSRARSVIADRMMTSLHSSAQLTTVVEVDVTAVLALQERYARRLREQGLRLTPTAFFARAVVDALRRHPLLNSSIDVDGATVVQHLGQHLGIAVDTPRGLMVPVVHDAGDLSLTALARRIDQAAERARNGQLTAGELSGGTFTLTNTGSRGALFDTPILVPGQVGILGTGAVVERPVVVKDADGGRGIGIRSMAFVALTYDHRLVDGADAARFLTTLRERLEVAQFEHELG